MNAFTDCTFGSPSPCPIYAAATASTATSRIASRLSRTTAACGCAYVIAGLCTEGLDGAFYYCLPSDVWDWPQVGPGSGLTHCRVCPGWPGCRLTAPVDAPGRTMNLGTDSASSVSPRGPRTDSLPHRASVIDT